MPVLTTLTMFGLGAAVSVFSTHNNKTTRPKKPLATGSLVPQQESAASANQDSITPEEDSGEAQLARAMPLAIAGSASALLSMANPLFALPAAFITGKLTIPLMREGIRKFKQHRHIANLLDTALMPTLIMLNQLLAASLVLTSISVSRRVLAKTYDRSRKSLSGILNTLPKKVWLLVDGVEVEVDYRHIKQGDVVVVNNTELVPVDGKVIKGEALIDQTMLTGEAVPAEKIVGDRVYAGTQVVSGRVFIELEKSGDQTHAGEVSSLILSAADRRTAVQERGEMVLEKSLPPLLALSGIVGISSGLSQALGVYFVCPGYSMRVLSPLALLQSLKESTDAGILVKDGRSLELLNGIDTVVFDKTGTLTDGELQVAQVISITDTNSETILSLAASAESTQTHPIARAIVNKARSDSLDIAPLQDTEYTVARGIQAIVGQHEVVVGSTNFLSDEGYLVSPMIRTKMQELGAEGYVTILVGIDKVVSGIIALDQVVRPEAMHAISRIKQRGMQTAIISGDAEAATQHMANKLNIDHYYAETLPGDKAQLIAKMQAEGRKICFIGDGINDAAALKQANVSMSIRGSSTIAVDTAQIVLVNANLALLNKLFEIADNYEQVSKHTTRLSVGLPLATLPIVLMGGGGVLTVLVAHNISTWSGLWRIMRKR
ncbi:MAG: heavy metal translocating P-type ATPase [Thiolinea sp.]